MENNTTWVSVQAVTTQGLAWKATKIYHRAPAETRMQHNVFVWCFENGQVVRDGKLQIKWGWQGQRSDEPSPNKLCDKKAPDPSTDIPIEHGQHIWLEVADQRGYPSDRVVNLHAELPGPGPAAGQDWQHHDYDVYLELKQLVVTQPPVITPPITIPTQPEQPTGEETVTELREVLIGLISDIRSDINGVKSDMVGTKSDIASLQQQVFMLQEKDGVKG